MRQSGCGQLKADPSPKKIDKGTSKSSKVNFPHELNHLFGGKEEKIENFKSLTPSFLGLGKGNSENPKFPNSSHEKMGDFPLSTTLISNPVSQRIPVKKSGKVNEERIPRDFMGKYSTSVLFNDSKTNKDKLSTNDKNGNMMQNLKINAKQNEITSERKLNKKGNANNPLVTSRVNFRNKEEVHQCITKSHSMVLPASPNQTFLTQTQNAKRKDMGKFGKFTKPPLAPQCSPSPLNSLKLKNVGEEECRNSESVDAISICNSSVFEKVRLFEDQSQESESMNAPKTIRPPLLYSTGLKKDMKQGKVPRKSELKKNPDIERRKEELTKSFEKSVGNNGSWTKKNGKVLPLSSHSPRFLNKDTFSSSPTACQAKVSRLSKTKPIYEVHCEGADKNIPTCEAVCMLEESKCGPSSPSKDMRIVVKTIDEKLRTSWNSVNDEIRLKLRTRSSIED